MNFGVLGGGIVGLTTALELQSQFRDARVTIVAEKWSTDTTSAVAAGIFRPAASFAGPTEEITQQWIEDAYAHWDGLRRQEGSARVGICNLSGYLFSSISPALVRNPRIEKILPLYRKVTEDELKICPGDWKYGSFFSTLLTEFRTFQPWAEKKFLANGGRFVTRSVRKITELEKDFDLVMNCTGLGSKWMLGDNKLVPVRGQIIKVKAPWVKTAFYGDYDTYIIPGFEGVTLGGTRQFDSYNLNICKYDSTSIRERCQDLLPSLRGAEVIRESVGLRPHRDPVRVEVEFFETSHGKPMRVIHNYGHGASGVTTSPGTAKYAVKLVRDALSGRSHL
uniref:FAD dependent oxidoreductase domain-containing protein n=1 Tax=Phlebotomus papatasi TaxID=29031 RepID=A0A1B0D1B1_PHLPP